MKHWHLLVCASLVATAASAGRADWKPVTGTYAVTAKNYLDPAEAEPRDSHLRLQLTGAVARDLYLAMKVAETRDECTGMTARKVGEMLCLHYTTEKRYVCRFAVDVMHQRIEYGVAC